MNLTICTHGKHGVLCHKCYPERHTYCAVLLDGTRKLYTAPDFDAGVQRGLKLKAVEIFKLIYPTQKHEVEAGDKELDEVQ